MLKRDREYCIRNIREAGKLLSNSVVTGKIDITYLLLILNQVETFLISDGIVNKRRKNK